MPLLSTRSNAPASAYGFTSGGAPEVLGGMVLITPTSIASTGTGNSSSINTNGSVTFDTCETLSLNGVFTSSYDNYMVVMRWQSSTAFADIFGRLRLSGTDATATTDYNYQTLVVNGTSVTGSRNTTGGRFYISSSDKSYRNGVSMNIYGPSLSQPTAYRTIAVDSASGAYIYESAGTHELSTAYDGFTFYQNATTSFSGLISVYGLVGA